MQLPASVSDFKIQKKSLLLHHVHLIHGALTVHHHHAFAALLHHAHMVHLLHHSGFCAACECRDNEQCCESCLDHDIFLPEVVKSNILEVRLIQSNTVVNTLGVSITNR
jgi:hypothetical protein